MKKASVPFIAKQAAKVKEATFARMGQGKARGLGSNLTKTTKPPKGKK